MVATRKLTTLVSPKVARNEVRQLPAWAPVPTTLQLRETAGSVEDRFGLSWWDALIVAAALEARCSFLLSEDLQDGMNFDGLVVLDPFSRDDLLEHLGL